MRNPTKPARPFLRAVAAGAFVVGAARAGASFAAGAPEAPFLGRWDLTPTAPAGNWGMWLEVKKDGDKLTGSFLGRVGSVLPLALVKVDGKELLFWTAQKNPPDESKPTGRAKVAAGKLVGTITWGDGKVVEWAGAHPPAPRKNASANSPHKEGKSIELFDGKSMTGWDVQDPAKPMGWSVSDGVMTNADGANNIVSKQRFKDFKVVAEYKIDKASNSGFYLRGRYELQIVDDAGKPPEAHGSTALYSRVAPSANAAKPAGEWQTLEATIVGNKLTASLNGQKVHDDIAIDGPTGGAFDVKEGEPGPIMIQGDHKKVWFRKITVTPLH